MANSSGWRECSWIQCKLSSRDQTNQKAPHTVLQSKQDPSWWSEMQIHTLFMQMRSRAVEQDVKPDAMSDFRTQPLSLAVKQTQCVCVTDSPRLNPLCCICCSLFCLLLFILNCCSQLVCDTLWKLPGPFSWMFCGHKLMKCCALHSAKGSPC